MSTISTYCRYVLYEQYFGIVGMVSKKTASASSAITSGLVTGSYAGAGYVFGDTGSLQTASVAPAGLTVFGAIFASRLQG